MWDLSFLTRDQTCVPCIARWILNHWTIREVPPPAFYVWCFRVYLSFISEDTVHMQVRWSESYKPDFIGKASHWTPFTEVSLIISPCQGIIRCWCLYLCGFYCQDVIHLCKKCLMNEVWWRNPSQVLVTSACFCWWLCWWVWLLLFLTNNSDITVLVLPQLKVAAVCVRIVYTAFCSSSLQ